MEIEPSFRVRLGTSHYSKSILRPLIAQLFRLVPFHFSLASSPPINTCVFFRVVNTTDVVGSNSMIESVNRIKHMTSTFLPSSIIAAVVNLSVQAISDAQATLERKANHKIYFGLAFAASMTLVAVCARFIAPTFTRPPAGPFAESLAKVLAATWHISPSGTYTSASSKSSPLSKPFRFHLFRALCHFYKSVSPC